METTDRFLEVDAWWDALGIAPAQASPEGTPPHPYHQALSTLVRVYHDIYVHSPPGDYKVCLARKMTADPAAPVPAVQWQLFFMFSQATPEACRENITKVLARRIAVWNAQPNTRITHLLADWVEDFAEAPCARQEKGEASPLELLAEVSSGLPGGLLDRLRAQRRETEVASALPAAVSSSRPVRL